MEHRERLTDRSGGYGNGTLKALSLDCDLFDQITTKLRFPATIRECIRSIHGVFVKFVEDEDGHGSPTSLRTQFRLSVYEVLYR